jgi:hypothetical protein
MTADCANNQVRIRRRNVFKALSSLPVDEANIDWIYLHPESLMQLRASSQVVSDFKATKSHLPMRQA